MMARSATTLASRKMMAFNCSICTFARFAGSWASAVGRRKANEATPTIRMRKRSDCMFLVSEKPYLLVCLSAPCRTRTYDRLLRRQLLYPSELREHGPYSTSSSPWQPRASHLFAISSIFLAPSVDPFDPSIHSSSCWTASVADSTLSER